MIRAHVPPFDTVSPSYVPPEKKVEKILETKYVAQERPNEELTYKEYRGKADDVPTNADHLRIRPNQTVPNFPGSYKTDSREENLLLERLLISVLSNPNTDPHNINKNMHSARAYLEYIKKGY